MNAEKNADQEPPEDEAGAVLDVAEDEQGEEWTRDDFLRDLRRASRPDEKPPKGKE